MLRDLAITNAENIAGRGNAKRPGLPAEIERARKFVGLHAD